MHNFLLFLHILGAGTWLGANVAQAALGGRIKASGPAAAVAWMRSLDSGGKWLYNLAGALVLVTGVLLVLDSHGAYSFEDLFVVVGIGMVVVGGALGGLVFSRGNRRGADLYEQGGSPAELRAINRRLLFWGVVDTVLLVATILAMVYRWGA